MGIKMDRIDVLKSELAALKQQRRAQKQTAKKESTWVKAEIRSPEGNTRRVLVWANDQLERCWSRDGKFYSYDGTWFVTEKELLNGVTHWMPTDWMYSKYIPKHGPGLMNRLRYLWNKFTDGAQDMAHDLRPSGWGSKAQLDKKVVYYVSKSGKVALGLPENRPAPKGCEKIICGSVQEAERYSELQRRQERVEHGRTMEQREQVEGSAQKEWRRNAHNLMANARNQVNRDFMEAALKRNAEHKPWQYTRESYLHNEGYEEKH